jgi:hypothetical protein
MHNRIAISSCVAALLSLSVAAAQTTTQTPTQSPVQGNTQGIRGQTRVGTDTKTATQFTLSGCVERESEYNHARGGDHGTGPGGGNEFVLSGAVPARRQPTGTSGQTSPATRDVMTRAYALTGSREADLAPHLGHRVEIVGTMDRDPRGERVTPGIVLDDGDAPGPDQRDPPLPRLTIVSFRPVDGSCP